jgi:hypothetical protein
MIFFTGKIRELGLSFPLLLLAVLAGCVSEVTEAKKSGGGKSVRSGEVGEIHLFGAVAISVNGAAAPAGLGVIIYASPAGGSRGQALHRGKLEIMMYDSAARGLDLRAVKPLKVWTFDAAQLEPFVSESLLGERYQLALAWEESAPKSKVVTVAARYRGPRGVELYSSPSAVSVTAK